MVGEPGKVKLAVSKSHKLNSKKIEVVLHMISNKSKKFITPCFITLVCLVNRLNPSEPNFNGLGLALPQHVFNIYKKSNFVIDF